MTEAVKTDGLSQRSKVLHSILGIAAMVALFLSADPRLAAYRVYIVGICTALGFSSIATARAYLPPRVRAIVENFSPTPVAPLVEP